MLKKLTLSSLLILITICSNAQNNKITINKFLPTWLQKVAIVDKKPEYKNISDGYFIFLSERQNNLETKEHYTHIIREISSSTGVQNGSEISISYDPSYEKLIFHKLTIWRDNKPIEKLNAHNFKILQNEKELSRFIYSGLFTAYAILDDVRKGDRIEFAYTIAGRNPVFTKYASTFYFESSSQCVNVYQNIIFNPSRVIKTKNFNNVPTLKKSVVNGLNVYEWQSAMSKTHVYNDNEPSHYDPYARVQISEFNDWKEVVDWGLSLKKFDLKNSKILNDKIEDLKQKSKNNKEKYIELATRFVQDEIRYMGIEIGEYSHRPNTPEKILKQRYGDCKDKSTLLGYILNQNGIEAYSVYLNTYLNKETDKLLPSPTVFNHEVLVVEYDDRNLFIDPTMSDQRGPIFENYFPYDANVLIIKPGANSLKLTPRQFIGKTKVQSVFKVADTSTKKKTVFNITTTYTKNFADNFRLELNSNGADNLEKTYTEYYANIYPGLVATAPLNITDNELENTITVKEAYEIEKFWIKEDDKSDKLLAYFYGEIISGQLKPLKNYRNAPFSLTYPATTEQNIKIILPEAWDLSDDNLTIDNENYRFSYNAHTVLDTLTLNYFYQNFKSELQPKDLEAYIKDKKEINNALSYGVYWRQFSNDIFASKINFSLVAFAIIFTLLITFISYYLYSKSTTPNLEAIKSAYNIGGWLIFVGIGVTLTPIIILVTFLNLQLFSKSTWQNLNLYEHSSYLQLILIILVILNVVLFVFSVLVMILFYQKRDILPKYYIAFLLTALLVSILDIFSLEIINRLTNQSISATDNYSSLVRQIIFCSIWISYFIKSERVKRTFVFSYPKHVWQQELRNSIIQSQFADNVTEDSVELNTEENKYGL
jgi:transglutaminase-like putative cysteine protease